MQVQLVDVICDTSFLIQIANKRITNLDSLEVDIGEISFVVPQVVLDELRNLQNDPNKTQEILKTLDLVKNFKILPLRGKYADTVIVDYVAKSRGIIATLDFNLKKEIKKLGGSIISLSKNKIILES